MRKLAFAAVIIYSASLTPLAARQLALICDGRSKDETHDDLTFPVMIDPDQSKVVDMGSGADVATDLFSETMIQATQRLQASTEVLIIDRVTGQFNLAQTTRSGGRTFEGICTLTERKF